MRALCRRLLLLLPWRRRAAEREIDEELRSLAAIAGPRELGNLTIAAEDARAVWEFLWLEDIWKDIRYGFRSLRRHPGFTATVVVSLAIGIGASTALFTLINAVEGRLLPVSKPDRLVALGQRHDASIEPGFTYQQFEILSQRLTGMTLAAYSPQRLVVSVGGAAGLTVSGELVSGSYFPLLGIHAVTGRLLLPADDKPGNGTRVAVISDEYWTEQFARDRNVVGRALTISGSPFTIVGVTPPEFFGIEVGTSPRVFVPLTTQPVVAPEHENLIESPHQFLTWVRVIGAMRPPVAPTQVRRQFDGILQTTGWEPPDKFTGRTVPVHGVMTSVATGRSEISARFSTTFVVLAFVVGTVLLIACANTANLVLARAAVRRPEFALRVSLGASRARIVRQVTVESLMLAAAAGGGGIALSYWATRAVVLFASAGQATIVLDLAPDLRVLAFAMAVSASIGLAVGLVPAVRVSRTRYDTLRDIGATRNRLDATGSARMFLIVQVALSIVLLTCASVFVSSLHGLVRQADRISARDQVLTVRVAPRGSDQRNTPGTTPRLDRVYRTLIDDVQHVPGVEAASMANTSPFTDTSLLTRVARHDGATVAVRTMMVYPHYFRALGVPLTAGRDFQDHDLAANASPVAIVNRAYVRQILGGADPLASTGTMAIQPPEVPAAVLPAPPMTIVGVVPDSPYPNLREQPLPTIYQTFLQTRTGRGQMTLYVRTGREATGVARQVREMVQRVDPYTPSFAVVSLADELKATLIRERLTALFALVFSGVVIVLVAVGLYGLTAFGVSRRTPEIGLRLAVGATGWDVYRLVVRQTARVVALGMMAGTVIAWGTIRIAAGRLSGLLFDVRPDDPGSFVPAMVALVVIAVVASFVPARRAMNIDPVSALREE